MKVKSQSEVAQLCLTLSDPMDYSLPGSSVHGIFQARVLEWGAIAFSTQIFVKVKCSVMSDSLRPVDCSPPGSSIHGILQARVLEWVTIAFSNIYIYIQICSYLSERECDYISLPLKFGKTTRAC